MNISAKSVQRWLQMNLKRTFMYLLLFLNFRDTDEKSFNLLISKLVSSKQLMTHQV